MKTLKLGTRVRLPNHDFLSEGYVLKVIKDVAYIIKLDEKAPNTYAWETEEVLMFPSDVEEINDNLH